MLERDSHIVRIKKSVGKHKIQGVSKNGLRWVVNDTPYSLAEFHRAYPTVFYKIISVVLPIGVENRIRIEYPELFPQLYSSSQPSELKLEATIPDWVRDSMEEQDVRWNARRKDNLTLKSYSRSMNNKVRVVR